MIYELEIAEDKSKSVIAFYKQLDFVKVRVSTLNGTKVHKSKSSTKALTMLPYFSSCQSWDIDAEQIRHGGASKRVKGW